MGGGAPQVSTRATADRTLQVRQQINFEGDLSAQYVLEAATYIQSRDAVLPTCSTLDEGTGIGKATPRGSGDLSAQQ